MTSQALMDKGTAYSKLSRAQDKEDIWLYENWFYGKERGVIVESGALDGMLYSTTHLFEKWAHWTPIHIEADPRNYFKLVRQREKGVNINAALCGEPKLLHYTNDDGGQIQGGQTVSPVFACVYVFCTVPHIVFSFLITAIPHFLSQFFFAVLRYGFCILYHWLSDPRLCGVYVAIIHPQVAQGATQRHHQGGRPAHRAVRADEKDHARDECQAHRCLDPR